MASSFLGHAFPILLWAASLNDFALQRQTASVKPHPEPAIAATTALVPHFGILNWGGGEGIPDIVGNVVDDVVVSAKTIAVSHENNTKQMYDILVSMSCTLRSDGEWRLVQVGDKSSRKTWSSEKGKWDVVYSSLTKRDRYGRVNH